MYQKFLKRFFGITAALLLAAAGLVILADPFFHYHEPLGGLKKVLTKKEYQSIGTLRNFNYDSLIVGSSTAENYNNRWFDEEFQTVSVKAIKSSGTTVWLNYYVREAFRNRELSHVFYSLDLFALQGDLKEKVPDKSMPLYLYDHNPFTDVNYVLNKDVIFKDIPYMAAESFLDDYDEGTSYNWAQYKVFGKEAALSHYSRPERTEDGAAEVNRSVIDRNVDILEQLVREHPETEFFFFYPPYSLLWWDSMERTGQLESSLYAARSSMERLLGYENVRMYYFQNEEDIVLNLDLYMDTIHFSADINHLMVQRAAEDKNRLTVDNYEDELEKMKILAERIARDYEELTRTEPDL